MSTEQPENTDPKNTHNDYVRKTVSHYLKTTPRPRIHLVRPIAEGAHVPHERAYESDVLNVITAVLCLSLLILVFYSLFGR